VRKDEHGHEGIRSVIGPPPRAFDSQPTFTQPLPPLTPSKAVDKEPDPSEFVEPFRITFKPPADKPPVTLLVLHPDGRTEVPETVSVHDLRAAMKTQDPTFAMLAACFSEVSRLRQEVDALKKAAKKTPKRRRK
jgi:hypothetical protein